MCRFEAKTSNPIVNTHFQVKHPLQRDRPIIATPAAGPPTIRKGIVSLKNGADHGCGQVKNVDITIEIIAIHDEQIAVHAGSPGISDDVLLFSAIARPKHKLHYAVTRPYLIWPQLCLWHYS